MKDCVLELVWLVIVCVIKIKELYIVIVDILVIRKLLGSKMGKGKGKVDYYVVNVMVGKVFFEFNCDNEI